MTLFLFCSRRFWTTQGIKTLENVESHFEIIVVSDKFRNIKRIDRHRMVNHSLKDEFCSDLHSDIIKTYTVEEYKNI